eukprot:5104893-Amphidinium_carterae.1
MPHQSRMRFGCRLACEIALYHFSVQSWLEDYESNNNISVAQKVGKTLRVGHAASDSKPSIVSRATLRTSGKKSRVDTLKWRMPASRLYQMRTCSSYQLRHSLLSEFSNNITYLFGK